MQCSTFILVTYWVTHGSPRPQHLFRIDLNFQNYQSISYIASIFLLVVLLLPVLVLVVVVVVVSSSGNSGSK
jgi:hypothetical protein